MESLLGTLTIFSILSIIAILITKSKKEKVFNKYKHKTVKLPIIVTLTILTINIIVIPIIFTTLKVDFSRQDESLKSLLDQYIIIKVVLLVLIAPISEELFFRRLVYAFLRKKHGIAVGYIISILLFAALHLNPITISHALVLGTFYTFLYERTNSISISIFAHSINNLFSIFIALFLKNVPIFFIEFNSYWRYIEFILAIVLLLWSLRQIHQITATDKQTTIPTPATE